MTPTPEESIVLAGTSCCPEWSPDDDATPKDTDDDIYVLYRDGLALYRDALSLHRDALAESTASANTEPPSGIKVVSGYDGPGDGHRVTRG